MLWRRRGGFQVHQYKFITAPEVTTNISTKTSITPPSSFSLLVKSLYFRASRVNKVSVPH